jgi:hypothetical protein
MEAENKCQIRIADAKLKTMFLPGKVDNPENLNPMLDRFDYIIVKPDVQKCSTHDGDFKCVAGAEITGIKRRERHESKVEE